MEITNELKMSIGNDIQLIKSVDVTYPNGEEISGFVKSGKFNPFEIMLCKHRTPKGENSYHHLDFARATCIKLIYHNGEEKIFV